MCKKLLILYFRCIGLRKFFQKSFQKILANFAEKYLRQTFLSKPGDVVPMTTGLLPLTLL